jgi:phytanoyl-CoA hydroxylase
VILGPDEQRHYAEHGFVLLPRLFLEDALARFEERFVALVEERVPRPERLVVMRDVEVVRGAVKPTDRLHGVNKLLGFEDDPVLFGCALHPPLLEAVRALVGPDLMTISTNVFNKPPGVDGRHPLHQDLRYFTLRPADAIVAAWTAIDRCRPENGCLAVVPGSHRGGLLRHGDPDWTWVNSGFFAAEDAPREDRVHVPMEPGDTLLFHPLLIHGSGRNRTAGFRRAISVHFASTACTRPSGPRKREPLTRVIPGPGAQGEGARR